MEYSTIVVICYFVGAIITTGVIGGVRDEMEGIGDIVTIALWPIVVLWILFHKVLKVGYSIGRLIRKHNDS